MPTHKLTGLPNARHRLAALRNRLHAELANLKSGSTIAKLTKGRMGGVMDAIEICDQELLAEEQGRALGPVDLTDVEPDVLRPDQLAWLAKRKGDV